MDSIKKENELNMIALAIFYIIILGFLFLMIYYIQKYFEIYTDIYNHELNNAIEIRKQMQNKAQNTIDFQKEINHVIQNRLSEFERKFPSISNENEIPSKFIEQTKKAISISLQLIKI
jgi:hypothetical protein